MSCIGIVGSRRRDTRQDCDLTINALTKIWKRGDTLVSGGCSKGGDRFAEYIAREWIVPIKIHYPDKSKLDPKLPVRVAYAKIAYARNALIAQDADVLIAVVAEDRKGGTENTIKHFLSKLGLTEAQALAKGKLVLV